MTPDGRTRDTWQARAETVFVEADVRLFLFYMRKNDESMVSSKKYGDVTKTQNIYEVNHVLVD